MGGHQPYVPIGEHDTLPNDTKSNIYPQDDWKQRARVLCSYDAKDSTELNLIANEVGSMILSHLENFSFNNVENVIPFKSTDNICK